MASSSSSDLLPRSSRSATTEASLDKMSPPPIDYSIYFVTGRELVPAGQTYLANLEAALQGGVTVVQVREKNVSTREFLQIAKDSKALCDKVSRDILRCFRSARPDATTRPTGLSRRTPRPAPPRPPPSQPSLTAPLSFPALSSQYNVPLIINDRLDIALLIDCAGWHGGQSDCPAPEARRLLGPDKIIGVSTNNEAELREVIDQGVADYVGIGPAYDTATKKDLSALLGVRGVAKLLGVLGESEVKSVVIGGVGRGTISNVLRQCAWPLPSGKYRTLDGLAVVSAIAAAADPKAATEELVALWNAQPSYPLAPHPATASPAAIIDATCKVLANLRDPDLSPLIHSITNQVVMNDSANLTLAFGASPIMSASAEEAEELGEHVGALLLNLGTVTKAQVECQVVAGKTANRRGRPVVVDPVGVGATSFRRNNAAGECDGQWRHSRTRS